MTSELSTLLKTMRMQRKITSKKLAAHIGKSPSYISKLENNEIRYIQDDELTEILDYVVEGEEFFSDKITAIIKTLSSFLEPDKMSQQIWLLNYDIFKRPLTLPEKLIDDINERLHKINFGVAQLTEWLNTSKDSAMSVAFPANEVVDYVFRDLRLLLIRFVVDEGELADLLAKRTLTTNYALIQALIFNLLRIENCGDRELKNEDARKMLQNTRAYLDQYGVYSLTEYINLLAATDSLQHQQTLLSVFSAVNAEIIDQIIKSFQLSSENDTLYTTQALEAFKNNLDWDLAFVIKLMSLPFYGLDQISFSLKKQLLDDIAASLEKYSTIPEYKKNIETY